MTAGLSADSIRGGGASIADRASRVDGSVRQVLKPEMERNLGYPIDIGPMCYAPPTQHYEWEMKAGGHSATLRISSQALGMSFRDPAAFARVLERECLMITNELMALDASLVERTS